MGTTASLIIEKDRDFLQTIIPREGIENEREEQKINPTQEIPIII